VAGRALGEFLPAGAVVTVLILAFVTPMLINKHPLHRRPPDFHPLRRLARRGFAVWRRRRAEPALGATAADAAIGIVTAVFCGSRCAVVKLFLKDVSFDEIAFEVGRSKRLDSILKGVYFCYQTDKLK